MMSDKELDGKWDQAKGKVKEGAGEMTGDKSLENEGKADQTKGKVKEGLGKVERKIKNALD